MPAPDSGRTVPLTDEILSRILAAIPETQRTIKALAFREDGTPEDAPGLDKRTEAEIAGDVDRTRRLLRTATQGPGRPPAPEEPDNP
jgi:hypothetical protein